VSSVTLPPRALSPGKEVSARQWYRYANVIPPQEYEGEKNTRRGVELC